jgi:hypothetical protein
MNHRIAEFFNTGRQDGQTNLANAVHHVFLFAYLIHDLPEDLTVRSIM